MLKTEAPAKGTHLFLIEDCGILFSKTSQEIHVLNTTAAVIWCHLEDGKSTVEIGRELAGTFNLDSSGAEHLVTTALDDWRRMGVLASSEISAIAKTIPDTYEQDKLKLPRWTDGPFVAERSYRLLSSRLRLRFSDPEQEAIVHPILAHLEAQSDGSVLETLIDILTTPQGMVLYRNKEAESGFYKINELAPVAKGLVWNTAILDHDFFLDIHAGVVKGENGCILLPAPPGSGKSTLTAALVSAGYQFFSDEVALLEEDTFNVFAMPLALCFKDTGFETISRFFPQVKTLPVHNRGDGKRVCYMPPPADARPSDLGAHPVHAVIFPLYRPEAPTKLDRMSTIDALKLLMDECIVVDIPLDKKKVGDLINWIDRIGAYRLTYSNTDEAISRIRAL